MKSAEVTFAPLVGSPISDAARVRPASVAHFASSAYAAGAVIAAANSTAPAAAERTVQASNRPPRSPISFLEIRRVRQLGGSAIIELRAAGSHRRGRAPALFASPAKRLCRQGFLRRRDASGAGAPDGGSLGGAALA